MTTTTARGRKRLVLDENPADYRPTPDDRPECEHGPMVRRAGFSQRTGAPFAGFYCQERPGCKSPIWVTAEVIGPALADWQAADPAGEQAKPREPKPAKDTASDAVSASAAELDVPPF